MHDVAIIGAGFTGSMIATHLLRHAPGELRIVLFERHADRPGGVAYRTSHDCHLLNVPVGRMSAFPDDPDHFTRWLAPRAPNLTAACFAPRALYGRYVGEILDDAARAARASTLTRVIGSVVAVVPHADSVELHLDSGKVARAAKVVIAIGNFAPAALTADPAVLASPAYIADPWQPGGLEAPPRGHVLIVGTGLTMLDVVLALRDRNHQGPITAISRRGLLPQPHRHAHAPPPNYHLLSRPEDWPSTVREMLRTLREEVRHAAKHGVDWREVVTALRAATPALWQKLDSKERARFLHRLRPYWETHRHRAAPEVYEAVEALISTGRLRIRAAGLVRLSCSGKRVSAQLRLKGGQQEAMTVDRLINCTGPETDLRRIEEPLISSARDAGLIRPDPLGLGLDTDADGRLIDARGMASNQLFLAGPLRKGRLWENTAVPELRSEVLRLAHLLLASMPGGRAEAPQVMGTSRT